MERKKKKSRLQLGIKPKTCEREKSSTREVIAVGRTIGGWQMVKIILKICQKSIKLARQQDVFRLP